MRNWRTGRRISPAACWRFLAAGLYCAGLLLALPSLANAAIHTIGGAGADFGTMKLLAEVIAQ